MRYTISYLSAVVAAMFLAAGCMHTPVTDVSSGHDAGASTSSLESSELGALGHQVLNSSVALVRAAPASGDWGDLKVQLVYDGDPPATQPVAAAANVAFCNGNKDLATENLVVDPKTKGIRYVVAFISQKKGDKQPPIHPDYEKTKAAELVLDNNGCRFEPHIALLRPSQTLIAGNSDPIGHNTNIQPISTQNSAKNFNLPPGAKEPYKFNVEETLPVSVVCNVHGWMKSYVVVKDHPYVGVSDADGKLVIANVPAGEWTFRFWHEESGYLREVAVGTAKSDKKGLAKLTIAKGDNDLGVVKVPASLFKK